MKFLHNHSIYFFAAIFLANPVLSEEYFYADSEVKLSTTTSLLIYKETVFYDFDGIYSDGQFYPKPERFLKSYTKKIGKFCRFPLKQIWPATLWRYEGGEKKIMKTKRRDELRFECS